jgi:hypothetical protein
MGARQAVLLTPSESTHPTQLLSYKQLASITSLESTLVEVFILNNLNLFRINTYEKHRGWGLVIVNQITFGHQHSHVSAFRPSNALSIYPYCSQTLAHSLAQRRNVNTFLFILLRTLSVATGGIPPQSPLSPNSGRLTRDITPSHLQPSTFNAQPSTLHVQSPPRIPGRRHEL